MPRAMFVSRERSQSAGSLLTDYSDWCDDSEALAMISKRGMRLGFTSVVSERLDAES